MSAPKLGTTERISKKENRRRRREARRELERTCGETFEDQENMTAEEILNEMERLSPTSVELFQEEL